jgi:zinc protease
LALKSRASYYPKRFLFILSVLPMLMSLQSLTAEAETRAFHGKLPNGLEVVVIPDHRSPVVTHMVWYKVGAADEKRGKSGIAHFLEHLMFKGTDKIPPEQFSKIIARMGGQDNAFTSQDITSYFQRVAKERLPDVMEMEADRMRNLKLTDEQVTTERKVVLEERRSRVDNDPSSILSEQMAAALYVSHPYGIPVIGWENEIKLLNRADAMAFYQKFYAPNNAIVVVAGDVEPAQVMDLARKYYGPLQPDPTVGPRKRVEEPEPAAQREVILKDSRAGKATLYRQYLTPSYTTAKNHEGEALELLAQILGSSQTGRLNTELVRKEKIATSAGGWYGGLGLDYARIGFYAVAAGDNKLEDVEASMDRVIKDVIDKGVTKEELDRAKNSVIAGLIYDADSQSNLARTYGWNLATGRTVEDVEERPQRFAAVTQDEIQAVAKKYLEPKRSVTGLLIPVPSQIAEAQQPQAPSRGDSGVLH